MAGLPWLRLDTSLYAHPKVVALTGSQRGQADMWAWVSCLMWSAATGADGVIPERILPRLGVTKYQMNRLAEARLLDPRPGGWAIHDYADYQQTKAVSKAKSDAARRAAQVRWKGAADA